MIKLIFILSIVALAIYLLNSKIIDLNKLGINFNKNDYKNVTLQNLVSYSNFYNEELICTEGYHVKSQDYNVLKTDINTDIFINSAWVEYEKGKEKVFDSLLDRGQAAKVSVCGKFESGRGKAFGNPTIWRKQITIEQYKLLDKPKPF